MGQSFAKDVRCPLSDPADPHTLSREDGGSIRAGCSKCGKQVSESSNYHYRCVTCNVKFHQECSLCPGKIRHPYHLQHPLTLIDRDDETQTGIAKTEHVKSESVSNRCNWCGEDLQSRFYRCSICGFCLDIYCSMEFPPPNITDPESHHHPLVFFPRPFLLPCDACGLVDISKPVYTCFQCNYMVHQSCIRLPRVIKITRHPHRLFYTPFFFPPQLVSTCRVCYKTVDIKYGQYACRQEGCSYVAHSRCATHEKVWDGKELEWEPEETNGINIQDVEPFEKVGVDLIKYFLHDQHNLKLHKYDRARDADKQCEACILPIDPRDFYSCTQCEFFLHEVCANLPRQIDHALHRHPLVLEPSGLNYYDGDATKCSVCFGMFSGFQYRCSNEFCLDFKVDIRCIFIPDCFTHKSHQHPLFIPPVSDNPRVLCNACGRCSECLQCTLCEFLLCYYCATIPDEVYYYKQDEHPLSLCYGEEQVDETYWCEICETKLDPTVWFYTCTSCCITIHRQCLLGSSVCMKHGFTFNYQSAKVQVVRNTSNTRPICYMCHNRCPDSVCYKLLDRSINICSLECLSKGIYL